MKAKIEKTTTEEIDIPFEIIISAENTKRRLKGSFSIIGNQKVLLSIANQILSKCSKDFYYGTVDIYSEQPPVFANTEPSGWDY